MNGAYEPEVDEPSETLARRCRFGEFEEFAEAISGFDLDFRQLDAGPSPTELDEVATRSGLATRGRFSRRYHQHGCTPVAGRTFGFVTGPAAVAWCGWQTSESTLEIFDADGVFEAISEPDVAICTLALSDEALAETASLLQLPSVESVLAGDEASVVRCDPSAIARLRATTDDLFARAAARGSVPDRAGRDPMAFDVPALVLRALASTSESVERPASNVRGLAVRRALEWLHAHERDAVTVRDLCEAARVSWRTLDYAFREHFEVTPKAYLRAVRLNGVRAELRAAAPGTTIATVANHWDFWHMGQFAADYRRQFG